MKFGFFVVYLLIIVFSPSCLGEVFEDQFDPMFQTGIFRASDRNRIASVETIMVQSDDKILIGGDFVKIGDHDRTGLAKLLENGTVDTSFNADTDGQVTCIALQPDGKIIIGGRFTVVGGIERLGLARLNPDGSLDESFNANLDRADINTIAVQKNGKIIIAGDFRQVSNQQQTQLARIEENGSLDTTFPSLPGEGFVKKVLIQADGKVLVAGTILSNSGNISDHLFRVNEDGTFDIEFDAQIPFFGSRINDVELTEGGKILIGGVFSTSFGGRGLALLDSDGTLMSDFIVNVSSVNDIEVSQENEIYIAGDFNRVNNISVERLARLNLSGVVDTTFKPSLNNEVNIVTIIRTGKLLIGGQFTNFSPRISKVARLGRDSEEEGSEEEGSEENLMCIPIRSKSSTLTLVCL